jgi:hypothetical protein
MEATLTLREPCRIHFRKKVNQKTKLTRIREGATLVRPHAAALDNGWSLVRVRVPW